MTIQPANQGTQQPTGQAPALRKPVQLGVPIKGLDEAFRLSQALAMASLVPRDLRGKPSDVLAIILYGQELGLAPMQAIQGIYIVNGRPTLAAQTWLALLRREKHRARVTDHTDTACTVELTRGDSGETHSETFTMDDAKRAGLVGKDVWKQHPRRMLLARAVSNACRFLCPEIALGFYAEGEEFEADERDHLVEQIHPPADRPTEPADERIEDAVVVNHEQAREELAQIQQDWSGSSPLQYSQDEIREGSA